MICECGSKMRYIDCYDTGSNGDEEGNSYAFNVHLCQDCGTLVKEDVWDNPGTIRIELNGAVSVRARGY